MISIEKCFSGFVISDSREVLERIDGKQKDEESDVNVYKSIIIDWSERTFEKVDSNHVLESVRNSNFEPFLGVTKLANHLKC